MKQIFIYSGILLVGSVLFSACTKNSPPIQQSNNNNNNNNTGSNFPKNNTHCNIVAVNFTSGADGGFGSDFYHITYDSLGRISQIIIDSGANAATTNFTYGHNSFHWRQFTVDTSKYPQETLEAITDSNGLIQNFLLKLYTSYGVMPSSGLDSFYFTYDGQGELIKSVDEGQNLTYTYSWQNGNVMSETTSSASQSVTVSFDYYTNEPSVKGDYFWLMGYFPGPGYSGQLRPQNLLKDLVFGDDTTNFYYTLDSLGNISQMSANANQGSVSYQWQCH